MQFKKLIAGVAAVAAALGGMALGTMTVNADTDTFTVPETATPSTITLNKADDADTSKSTYTAYRIAAYIDPVANADGQADFLWPEAVDSDKWDGNIREAIAVAGKDGQKLVLLYNAVVAKAAVDDQVTNSATANYNGGADSEAATTVVKLGFFTMKKIDKQHNGIGGALFSVSDSGGNAVVFEKGSANGSWVRAADQSVKVDNVTYFTSIPTNAGGLSHWRATR